MYILISPNKSNLIIPKVFSYKVYNLYCTCGPLLCFLFPDENNEFCQPSNLSCLSRSLFCNPSAINYISGIYSLQYFSG